MHNKKPILFMTAFLAFSAMAVGCKDSGSSVNDDSTSVDANHEHAFDKKVVNEAYLSHEATCEEAAEYYYSCSCGAKGTETFSFGEKTGHQFDYSHWHSDEFTHWHESTCGHEVKADEGNHVFDQFIANENTFAVSGNCDHGTLYYVSCVCGKLGTATFEGGQLGDHPFDDEWKSDATGHWHESKCYHGVKKDFAEHTMEFVKVLHFGGDNDSLYKCSICGYEEARANDPLQILSVEIEHEYESDSDITADSTVRMTLKTNLQEDIPLTLPDGSIDIPIQSNFVESVTKNPTCEEDGVISFVPNNKLLFLKYVQNGTRDENGDSRISLVTLKSIIDVLWEEDQFHINFAYCAYGHDIKLVATADHSDCGGQALKQHFECSKCHKCFSDSSGSNPVSRESLEDSNDFIFFVEDAMHWTGRGTLVRGKARTDGKELVGKNYYLYGMDGFKYSDKITYVLFDDTCRNSLWIAFKR